LRDLVTGRDARNGLNYRLLVYGLLIYRLLDRLLVHRLLRSLHRLEVVGLRCLRHWSLGFSDLDGVSQENRAIRVLVYRDDPNRLIGMSLLNLVDEVHSLVPVHWDPLRLVSQNSVLEVLLDLTELVEVLAREAEGVPVSVASEVEVASFHLTR